MKNFAYLECKNVESISKKIEKFLLEKKLTKLGWNLVPLKDLYAEVGELKNFISSLNLEAHQIYAICNTADITIHIDYSNNVRINFPVANTVDTATTIFYELENLEKTTKYNSAGLPYYDLKYNNKKEIDRYMLSTPVAFNPKIPHGVEVYKRDKLRIILTIFLTTNPIHLLST